MPQCSPNSDRITVGLAPDGDGRLLTFTQEGVDIAAERRQTPAEEQVGSEAGWNEMFTRVDNVLG